MFFGQFNHKLNAKNQVVVPARYRDQLPEDEKLYLFRKDDTSLLLYTQEALENVFEKMRRLAGTDPGFRRMFTSRVRPVDMDAQGRIVIPADLKAAIGIGADVAFIGNGERIEVWPLERWQEFETNNEPSYQQTYDGLMDDVFES